MFRFPAFGFQIEKPAIRPHSPLTTDSVEKRLIFGKNRT